MKTSMTASQEKFRVVVHVPRSRNASYIVAVKNPEEYPNKQNNFPRSVRYTIAVKNLDKW